MNQETVSHFVNFSQKSIPGQDLGGRGPQKRFRLHGKQPDPAVPEASQKRLVQSRNDNVASVQWSRDEIKEIDQAQDWRQRRRIEKRLLRNRTAQAEGKRFILPVDADTPAKCRDCLKEAKKTSGVSRFLTEPCGGSVDIGVVRDPRASRDSVRLKQHRDMAEAHNLQTMGKSLRALSVPQNIDEEFRCVACGELAPHSWRRFGPFSNKLCPMANQ